MVTFDGSTRSYAGRNTLTAVAERAYSQICAMYMGSRDCASAENRCPEPTTTTAIQLTESPTALPTAKPTALPTVPTTTGKPTTTTIGKPTTSTAQLGATTAEPTTKVQLPTTTMGSTATTNIASDFHSFVTTTDQPTKKQKRKTKKRKNKKKRGKRSKKRKSK